MGQNLNPFRAGRKPRRAGPATVAPSKTRSPAVLPAGLLKIARKCLLRRGGRRRIALLALLGLLVVLLLMLFLRVLRRVRGGRRRGRGRGRGRGRLGEGRAGDQGKRDDRNELLEHVVSKQGFVCAQRARGGRIITGFPAAKSHMTAK